ncbi:MAG: penicillin-binding transpeptidase domain-containing protein [Phycisphaerales bacterium]
MSAITNAVALQARRRLGLLAALAMVAVGVLTMRLWMLTVWRGEELRETAERRLDRSVWIPSVRGSILDRRGRVLARDMPSWDVAVDFEAIDGSWVRERAARQARRDLGRSLWSRLPREARQAAVQARLPAWQAQLDAVLDRVADLAEVPRPELRERMERVRTQVQRRAERTWERQRAARMAAGESADSIRLDPIREQQMSHVVVHGVPDAVAFALRRLGDDQPGTVEIVDATHRERPWEGADVLMDLDTLPQPLRRRGTVTLRAEGMLDHVVGSVREEAWSEDLSRRPFTRPDGTVDPGGYGPTPDTIGARGLEAAHEDHLRGERGRLDTNLETGVSQRTDPRQGRDLRLTIDAALQARVQAILNPRLGLTRVQPWQHAGSYPLPDGTKLASAAVVLDVESGEILALGSWPTLADAAELSEDDQRRLMPGLDRASQAVYPPGSIVKPLIYAGAVARGKLAADAAIACNGHFFPGHKDRARCWIWRPQYGMTTHSAQCGGALDVEAAISRSCNIYFYTVAQKLGLSGLVAWYRDLGLGQTLGTGLQGPRIASERGEAGESSGILPGAAQVEALQARRDAFTPVIMGIGQGPIAWTPLQAANAYATLARGGQIRDPRIVQEDAALPPDRRGGSLGIPPRAVKRALEGLRQSVEAGHGTAHHVRYGDGTTEPIFQVPGVRVWGKTGTAQAPPLRLDQDGDGRGDRTVSGLDHAWFVGLAGDRADSVPRYAIAVVVEHGGSGGKTAGPVAEQVVHALLDEGYLGPGRSERRPEESLQRERPVDPVVTPPDVESPEG